MTEAQGNTLIAQGQTMQQVQADIVQRMDAIGHLFGLACYLLLACALLLALRRSVRG